MALNVLAAFRSLFFSLKSRSILFQMPQFIKIKIGIIVSYVTSHSYLVFLAFGPVPDCEFIPGFLGPETTAAEVDAIPETVVAAIAATPNPEVPGFLPDVLVPVELFPLVSCRQAMLFRTKLRNKIILIIATLIEE